MTSLATLQYEDALATQSELTTASSLVAAKHRIKRPQHSIF